MVLNSPEQPAAVDRQEPPVRKPSWLKVKLPYGENYLKTRSIVSGNNLHTICESGNCPNVGECWGRGTATFMILGNICTRSCGFCAVKTGRPSEPDMAEPARVARSVQLMGVKHCVITSVDRDDLPDGGADIWASTIRMVREYSPATKIETLIPDFKADPVAIQLIVNEKPDVVSHNLETVRRLTRTVRIQAKYDRSLEVLSLLKQMGMTTKSGIMVGLGETSDEVLETMDDLRAVHCDIFTIGQYLRPSPDHLPVTVYVTPAMFEYYKEKGIGKGFRYIESGPLVRSSYHAERHVMEL